jgi:hypothetical protein
LIELIAVLHMGPVAAARKDMHASIRQAAQHEQSNIESAGSIILTPDYQGFGLHF